MLPRLPLRASNMQSTLFTTLFALLYILTGTFASFFESSNETTTSSYKRSSFKTSSYRQFFLRKVELVADVDGFTSVSPCRLLTFERPGKPVSSLYIFDAELNLLGSTHNLDFKKVYNFWSDLEWPVTVYHLDGTITFWYAGLYYAHIQCEDGGALAWYCETRFTC